MLEDIENEGEVSLDFQPENKKIHYGLEEMQKSIFENSHLQKELLDEKSRYFSAFGRLKETSPTYLHRINSFLNWFIFDYQTKLKGQSVLSLYADQLRRAGKEIEFSYVSHFSNNTHGLFELLKVKDDSIKVRDLFNKRKIFISQKNALLGLSSGDVFESRVFEIDNIFYFSNYLILHPAKVRKQIMNKVKSMQKQKKDSSEFKSLIFDLQLFHYKWESYQHIDINSIYKLD